LHEHPDDERCSRSESIDQRSGWRVRDEARKSIRTQDESDQNRTNPEYCSEIWENWKDHTATEADEERTENDRTDDESIVVA
jgi:hypothetical protein